MISALSAQAGNMWFQAGLFALLYDGILFVAVLIGFWKVLRKYRQELLFNLAILILFSLIYLLFIPGPAGESRFRVPADPLLALAMHAHRHGVRLLFLGAHDENMMDARLLGPLDAANELVVAELHLDPHLPGRAGLTA